VFVNSASPAIAEFLDDYSRTVSGYRTKLGAAGPASVVAPGRTLPLIANGGIGRVREKWAGDVKQRSEPRGGARK